MNLKPAQKYKSTFRKHWRRLKIWKYPIVFIWGAYSCIPALHPGVIGFKTNDGSRTERISLADIHNLHETTPDWCNYTVILSDHGLHHYGMCGITSKGIKEVVSLELLTEWKGEGDDNFTYKIGEKMLPFDAWAYRDWEWLKFYYGYGPFHLLAEVLLEFEKFAALSLLAPLLLIVFVALDIITATIYASKNLMDLNLLSHKLQWAQGLEAGIIITLILWFLSDIIPVLFYDKATMYLVFAKSKETPFTPDVMLYKKKDKVERLEPRICQTTSTACQKWTSLNVGCRRNLERRTYRFTRRFEKTYCAEAEDLRKQITGVELSTAPNAFSF